MKTLATRIRPKKLAELVGQKHIKILLEKIIEAQKKTSLLFFGNPGVGKTTVAIVMANELNLSYAKFNATTDSKKELMFILTTYDAIIIDEIHRLNKDKQDILLPYLETGKIVVFATTTENPYFVINPAVRSRLHVLEFKPLSSNDICEALIRIVEKYLVLKISKILLQEVAIHANGDFRSALNSIELLSDLYPDQKITKKIIKVILPSINFASDRNSTLHYDYLSAFHKSLRGSDVDAALYYLAYLLRSGDYQGIFRRLLAFSYEDIGLANPNMPLKVKTAIDIFNQLGMPEGAKCLAQIVIEMALSKKSNSVDLAISKAFYLIDKVGTLPVPNHLRSQNYKFSSSVNKAKYLFPHDYKDHYVVQKYLPDQLVNEKIYIMQNTNVEKVLNQWIANFVNNR